MEKLTDDRFLDGRLRFLQPVNGYRAATDPVFMAAAVAAKPGQSVLELGCGAGVALGCLLSRVPMRATGVEIQQEYADLALKNMERNNFSANIIIANLENIPVGLRNLTFDHVMMNPPFFETPRHSAPKDHGKSRAFLEGETGLHSWITSGLKRLKPLGWLTIIHRAERLGQILAGLEKAGDIHILPLSARHGRSAGRVIVRARKGAAGPLRLLPPFILHKGEVHGQDGDDFSDLAREILRNGKALVMSGQ
ncbi:MAG: methyltransferase domain-containing protein [Rhodobacteraceae bacterium]|nr:methyltransferase domain-containing protein [Paracoccaceae bacterium]